MRFNKVVATVAAALMAAPGAASAAEVLRSDKATMEVNGRLQLLGFAQRVKDTERADGRMYLFLKQGRVGISGNVEALRYGVSLAFGGEEEIKAPSPGLSLSLMDMYVDIPVPVVSNTYMRVGQFKVPYGRERLTDSGSLLFAERSVQNLATRVGRDVGATLHTRAGPVVAGVGIFTGGGRDIPERYLPQRLGIPMVVFRAGFDGGLGEDVFAMPDGAAPMSAAARAKVNPDSVQGGVFFNALYTKDSKVGHASVLVERQTDIPLVLNKNWNPYLGQAPTSLGSLMQVGADAVVRAPAGPGVLSGEVEANYAVYENDYGKIAVPAGRVQAGYRLDDFEIAARYAIVLPSENFANSKLPITGTEAFSEVTPALIYNFPNFPARVVADLPVQLNVPVITEPGIGAYVLTEQPDQVSYLAKGGVLTRQTVVNARLMVQASF